MERIKNQYKFTYLVNGEAKTVTVIAELKQRDKKLVNASYIYAEITNKFPEIPDKFVGVARFKDGDTYDVEVGKKIARAKALRQANKIMTNVLLDVEDKVSQYITNLTKLRTGTDQKRAEYDTELAVLTGKV